MKANEKGEWCEHMTNDMFKLLCTYGVTAHKSQRPCVLWQLINEQTLVMFNTAKDNMLINQYLWSQVLS